MRSVMANSNRKLSHGRQPFRGPRRHGRGMLVAIGLLGAAGLLIGLALLMSMQREQEVFDVQAAVNEALEALDEPNLMRARRLAGELRRNPALSFEELGGPAFIIGAATAADAASQQSQLERRRQYLIASRYLEEAKQRGFPRGRQKQGLVLLATTTFLAEQFEDAIPRIEEALKRAPERGTEFSRMLSECHRLTSPPDWEAALQYVDTFLADPLLTPQQRGQGYVHRAEILFQLERFDDCLQQVDEISNADFAGEALVLRARIHIDHARREQEKENPDTAKIAQRYTDAARDLEDPRVQLKRSADSTRLAQFLLGECYMNLQQDEQALKQFGQVRRQYFGFPESLAASFEEAELLRKMQRDDKAVAAYQAVLPQMDEETVAANPLLELETIRKRVAKAYNDYFDRKLFDKSLQIVETLASVLTEADTTKLRADAYQAWAEELIRQAETQPLAEVDATIQSAETKLRQAGDEFAKLAQLRIASADFEDILFQSAKSYLRGNDFKNAAVMVDVFFNARPSSKIPEAFVIKGEALLSLNELDAAVDPLKECIDHHRESPQSYEARLILSRVYNEQQNIEAAKQALRDNLESELRPESLVWRESLYDLGRVLFLQATQDLAKARAAGLTSPGETAQAAVYNPEAVKALESSYRRFGEAIFWLEQAVTRWPQEKRSILARYMNAKAHEHRAKFARFQLLGEQIEQTKDLLLKEIAEELGTAHNEYEQLILFLDKPQDGVELTDIEQKILRNCYFARADALFDMNRFEEAIQAYSSASNRYQHRPAALEAFVQIAACYRRLNNPAKARGTLEQAKVVLDRIGTDADYAATTTRASYKGWKDFLDWLSQI